MNIMNYLISIIAALALAPAAFASNADSDILVKIEKAKNLLRFSDFSMVEIASYLSFSSQSHFIKLFSEETNLTPKKYRKLYYGTHWKGSEDEYSVE